jgi:hypothetical protein
MALAAMAAAASPVPVGSLVGSRNATLDGQAPLPHTTLLSGDNLQVNDGLAMVALERGNRMILGRGSKASFTRDADIVTVSLTRGDLSLFHPKAGGKLRVKAGNVSVEPEQGSRTLGEIAMVDGLLVVRVKDGVLQVEDAGTTKEVSKGSTITIATTAAHAPAPTAPGNLHFRHILNHEALVDLGVAAVGAGAAVAAVALTRSSRPVSPVTPAP